MGQPRAPALQPASSCDAAACQPRLRRRERACNSTRTLTWLFCPPDSKFCIRAAGTGSVCRAGQPVLIGGCRKGTLPACQLLGEARMVAPGKESVLRCGEAGGMAVYTEGRTGRWPSSDSTRHLPFGRSTEPAASLPPALRPSGETAAAGSGSLLAQDPAVLPPRVLRGHGPSPVPARTGPGWRQAPAFGARGSRRKLPCVGG